MYPQFNVFGIGDWGLGTGDWGQGDKGDKGEINNKSQLPITNYQLPMPNAQCPMPHNNVT
ncbi:hypothetical protein NIES2107_12510 [Nostoc carneum NIES-2107]|nr:hypothetical protein NIES2107_12510 [Nostoc carneum NIES-2107]